MRNIITKQWHKFPQEDKLQFKQYFVEFLANKGPTLDLSVLKSVIILITRMIKLGWFDNPKIKDIIDELKSFLLVKNGFKKYQ